MAEESPPITTPEEWLALDEEGKSITLGDHLEIYFESAAEAKANQRILLESLTALVTSRAADEVQQARTVTENVLRSLIRDVPPGVTHTTLRDHACNTGIEIALQELGFEEKVTGG